MFKIELYYFWWKLIFDFWFIDCDCYINGSIDADGSICINSKPCPCDTNGICTCQLGYMGDKCDKCQAGYFDLDENNLDSTTSCSGMCNFLLYINN